MPTREQEIEMMTHSERWPHRPRLPLKKTDGIFDPLEGFAVLVHHPIKGLLFFPSTVTFGGELDSANGVPTDPQKLYDAGWRVD